MFNLDICSYLNRLYAKFIKPIIPSALLMGHVQKVGRKLYLYKKSMDKTALISEFLPSGILQHFG